MGLPVVPRAPGNLLISGATSGNRTETLASDEMLFVIVGVTAGGAGASMSGGATWTTVSNTSDGTRRVIVFKGTSPTAGSQTMTLSFTNTTTCRWSIVAATGISTATPDAASDSLTTASSARTSSNCSSAGITTSANVLGVLALVSSTTLAGTITLPSGWTRITAATGVGIVLGYVASSSAFSAEKGAVSYGSTTSATQGTIAAFNGDDQGGQPMAKRWGGVPHAGTRSRRVW